VVLPDFPLAVGFTAFRTRWTPSSRDFIDLQPDCGCSLCNSSRSLEQKRAVSRSSPPTIPSTMPPISLAFEERADSQRCEFELQHVAMFSIDSMTARELRQAEANTINLDSPANRGSEPLPILAGN